MDLTGIPPGAVYKKGDSFIFLTKAYAGDIKPKTLHLKTDHFKVGQLCDRRYDAPIGYVFKPNSRATHLDSCIIFGAAQSRLTLEAVLAARVHVKPLYKFDAWSYFEYSGMIEVVVFKPSQTLIERFDQ